MRFTKIVCTLGPASKTREQIRQLHESGMNIARLNMSHGTLEGHRQTIGILREMNAASAAAHPPRPCIGILMDLQGAEIRTHDVKEPQRITKGEEVVFSFSEQADEKRQVVRVNHTAFVQDVRGTDRILIDNGELTFDIVSVDPATGIVIARAGQDGMIGSRRHVNLPGATIDLPSITGKDWKDIEFGIAEGVDFIGLSFIRQASDVRQVRDFVKKMQSHVSIISKIETRQAVEDIAAIIDASDGIMVARGDLGAEVPFEQVPAIQDEIVTLSRDAGKPVIVATHMLESMIHFPMPTRAEATDVAHAATTLTDATMLSGETASGKFPVPALEAMDRVLRATEEHMRSLVPRNVAVVRTEREARAQAAVSLTQTDHASALVVMTRTGRTGREVSKFRPRVPVIAFTVDRAVQCQLQLSYGVIPLYLSFSQDPEETVRSGLAVAKEMGFLHTGDRVVLISDAPAHDRHISSIQVRLIE
ncbi:MAG: pyruvate kinase [Candidatus Peregrinibacteria bacterium Greene0416_19]|nr:MAG: pyruvate kinase [Candidatus Peregrinibacteria bacterium Greene0416_19]